MFCSKCGKENADDAKFCSSCGGSLSEINNAQSLPKKMKLKIRWGIFVAVIMVVSLIAIALKMSNNNDNTIEAAPAATEEFASAAEAILPPAYEAAASVSISEDVFVDNDLNLMWQDNSEAKAVQKNWQGAIDYCEDLSLAGFDDWHLPNENMIMDLHHKRDKLKNIANGDYWSSTRVIDDSNVARYVLFKSGSGMGLPNYKRTYYYIRCARDNR